MDLCMLSDGVYRQSQKFATFQKLQIFATFWKKQMDDRKMSLIKCRNVHPSFFSQAG